MTSLEPVVRRSWGPDTCDPADLAQWRAENPSRGQCGTTALVVQDLLGGELLIGEVHEHGAQTGWHYWNRLPDGTEVDLTREQFRPGETVGAGVPVARPAGAPRRCRGQYQLLRHRVLTGLGDGPPAADGGRLTRIALVLLVDADDAVLLQLRDRDAAAEPGQWSLPGGHVEAGEEPECAARRELAEETGLAVVGELRPFWQAVRPDLTGAAAAVEFHVYTARCAPAPRITLGEGQEARFVPIADLRSIDLSPTAAVVLARLMESRRAV